MDLGELSKQVKLGKFMDALEKNFPAEFALSLEKMCTGEIEKLLKQVMGVPVNISGEIGWMLFRLYYDAAWFNIYEKLDMHKNISVLEIGAGDSSHVLEALEAYSGEMGRYVTFNLNKELTGNFLEKTKNMRADIRIVEDNGMNVLDYYDDNSFHVIAFHHAINDIIQTIIADMEGIDTVNSNWWEIEPQMLRAVMSYYNGGKLKAAAYEGFIDIIEVCRRSLKKGGYMVFDNCTFAAGYESLGYSMEFHSSYIDLAREWIREADLGLEPVRLNGYDSKWWMVLRG